MRKRRLSGPAGLLVMLFLCTLFLLAAQADERNRAGLVVDLGDGVIETVCVNFTGEDISGFDLLQASGLAVEIDAQGIGAAVCRIAETGCPAGNCFCQCKGADCTYWSYWHQVEGAWEYSAAGAGTYRVGPGDVEGWTWGPGSVTEAIEPPSISFAEICAAPTSPPAVDGQAAAPPVEAGGESSLISPLYVVVGLFLGGLLIGGIAWRKREADQA